MSSVSSSSTSIPIVAPNMVPGHGPGEITVPPRSRPTGRTSQTKVALIASAALLSLALIGVILAFASRSKARRAQTTAIAATLSGKPAAPGGPSSPAGPAQPATPEPTIDLTVRASPAEATIYIDGKAMPANPASTKRPRDGAMHLVRIEAPGYEPREESIGFDRSAFITVDLKALPPPVVEAPPPPNRTQGRTTRPPRAPRPHSSSGKSIDSENPYQ
jgi:serine/threonine-protein kinase